MSTANGNIAFIRMNLAQKCNALNVVSSKNEPASAALYHRK